MHEFNAYLALEGVAEGFAELEGMNSVFHHVADTRLTSRSFALKSESSFFTPSSSSELPSIVTFVVTREVERCN